MLIDLPVTERRLQLAGVSTAVLEGGEGPPLLLLHGPGESALWWMRVLPDLVTTHRVIVPDLPGHGDSEGSDRTLTAEGVFAWLDELIEDARDDPKLEQPDAFLEALSEVLGGRATPGRTAWTR